MQRTMVRGLLTYLDEAYAQYKFCLPKPLKLPPASHFFWKPLRRYPQARYLLKRAPAWLNKSLPTVPWGDVLAHEDRPRCTNCEFWRHIETCSVGSETPEKLSWGECCHKKRPLGTEMTPGGALCGTSWMRRD